MAIVPKKGDEVLLKYRTGRWLIISVRPVVFKRHDLFYNDFDGIERKVWHHRDKSVGDVKEYKITAKRLLFLEDSKENFESTDEEDDRLYDSSIKEIITPQTYDRLIDEHQKQIDKLRHLKYEKQTNAVIDPGASRMRREYDIL